MNDDSMDKDRRNFRPDETALTMVSSENGPDPAAGSGKNPAETELTMSDADLPVPPVSEKAEKEPESEGPGTTRVMSAGSASEVEKTLPMKTIPVSSVRSTSLYEPQLGDRIDRYVIVKKLGQGGMGSVYLARHETLGVLRALKVLSGVLYQKGGEFVKRFMQEARIACSISNPNIVNVLDVGEDPERSFCWIVMEYVDGGTIRDVLRKIPHLSEIHALAITRSAAEALKAAAEQRIVHRDIKPDNIMLTRKGEVKLADLGIAKNTDENVQLTRSHVMMGTPAYLAPEQAQDAHAVDVRADIYSLGATLYEMLTGEIPYPGKSTYDILKKMVSEPVPDPRAKVENISAPTARLVMRMLAKQAKQRPGSAAELLKDIAGLNVFPRDFDSSAAICELLEQSGSGSYAPDAVTPTVDGTASIRMVRQMLLKIELALRNISFFDSFFSFCHRKPAAAVFLAALFLLLILAVPAAVFFFRSNDGNGEVPRSAPVKKTDVPPDTGTLASEAGAPVLTTLEVPNEETNPSVDPKNVAEEKKRAEEEAAEKSRVQKQREEELLAEERKRAEEEAAEKSRVQKQREEEEKRIAEELRRKMQQERKDQTGKAAAPRKVDLFVEISPAGAKVVLRNDRGMVVEDKVVPADGKIRFQAPEGQYRLTVSFPGFQTAERTVPVSESRTISCVRIDLVRDVTLCKLNFYGSPKLLEYLRKTGLEARVDEGEWFVIREFPFKLEVPRARHMLELREKGILPQKQILELQPDQERINCDLYLREKDAELAISTKTAGKIEINSSGIWTPLFSPVPVKPFRPFDFRWRVQNGPENVIPIPELEPGSAYTVVLEERKKTVSPGAAEYAEAESLLKKKEYREAAEKLKASAEKGNADAVFRLAQMDEAGQGRWFSSDADALAGYKKIAVEPYNHREAQYKLGEFYENGRGGLDRDLRTALSWYNRAAEQKQPDALYRLGMASRNGDGGEPVDYVRMVRFFTEAAELGHLEAQYHLGYCYENGLGVPINVKQAKFWYGKAAERGHTLAQRRAEVLETIK